MLQLRHTLPEPVCLLLCEGELYLSLRALSLVELKLLPDEFELLLAVVVSLVVDNPRVRATEGSCGRDDRSRHVTSRVS